MPELPEVEALADHLRRHAVGLPVGRVDVSALSVLKTFDPPPTALHGQTVADAHRWGKYLGLRVGEFYLITHLSRAGWLRWSDKLAAAPLKPGKSPIALRVHLGTPGEAPGFDLTEAGTQKRLAIYVVRDPAEVPGIARLGPDALGDELTLTAFAGILAAAGRSQIKGVLRSQSTIAGIGNAYSDEILHAAHLSPFRPCSAMSDAEVRNLYECMRSTLTVAIDNSVGHGTGTLKAEKKANLSVHGRAGEPCPVCGDTVREVSFADSALQYCATCQTGGKPLADRRMSKLLK